LAHFFIKYIYLKVLLKTNMFLIEKEKQILFLENLLTKVKNNNISQDEQREISEFYVNYIFSRSDDKDDEEKILKYTSLGWYIYEFLINK